MSQTTPKNGRSSHKAPASRSNNQALAALMEITRLLARELSLDDLLTLIVDKASEVMQAERSTLYLVDEQTGELWSKVAQQAELQEIRLGPGQGLAGYAYRTGEVINVQDAYSDPRFNPQTDLSTGWRTRNMLVMPMRNPSNQVVGVFQVMNKKDGVFDAADEDLLSAFSSAAAVSIESSRLRKRATADFLTGVLNRQGFQEMYERELSRARRYRRRLALIMFDADNFKAFNDALGHTAGDEVLCALANTIKSSFRLSDIVARYGGDEFVAILPETGREGAASAVKRFLAKLEELNRSGSLPGRLEVSVGFASTEDDYDDLIERADAAMYEDKRRHRQNCDPRRLQPMRSTLLAKS